MGTRQGMSSDEEHRMRMEQEGQFIPGRRSQSGMVKTRIGFRGKCAGSKKSIEVILTAIGVNIEKNY